MPDHAHVSSDRMPRRWFVTPRIRAGLVLRLVPKRDGGSARKGTHARGGR
jgi:hypothetical protein